ALDAFCLTELTLSAPDIMTEYRDRWAGAIAMRDAHAGEGRGSEQWRQRQRIRGANPVRLVMAAARTLWGVDEGEGGTPCNLGCSRPWDRQQVAPSQLEGGACRAT